MIALPERAGVNRKVTLMLGSSIGVNCASRCALPASSTAPCTDNGAVNTGAGKTRSGASGAAGRSASISRMRSRDCGLRESSTTRIIEYGNKVWRSNSDHSQMVSFPTTFNGAVHCASPAAFFAMQVQSPVSRTSAWLISMITQPKSLIIFMREESAI